MRMLTIAAAAAASLALTACGGPEDEVIVDETAMVDPMATTTEGTIVEVAQTNPDLSTLVNAVTAADLGGTLSGPGPYTVFAPTNAAFDELPAGTLETLTTTDTAQLGDILRYHVVEGDVNAAALTQAIETAGPGGYTFPTVGGGTLTATLEGANVILTDAAGDTVTVTQTDVDASNGVVHVVDGVLMPA